MGAFIQGSNIIDGTTVGNNVRFNTRGYSTASVQIVLRTATTCTTQFEVKWSMDGSNYSSFDTAKTKTFASSTGRSAVSFEPFDCFSPYIGVFVKGSALAAEFDVNVAAWGNQQVRPGDMLQSESESIGNVAAINGTAVSIGGSGVQGGGDVPVN